MIIKIPHILSTIKVCCRNIKIRRILLELYRPYVKWLMPKDRITAFIKVYPNCVVVCRGKERRVFKDRDNNIIGLVTICIRKLLVPEKDWGILHGSSFLLDGKVIALLGESGAGKSTMNAYMTSRPDILHVSEDMLLINYRNNTICPYPRSIFLRDGGMRILSDNKVVNQHDCDRLACKGFERYKYKPQNSFFAERAVACYILLERTDDDELGIRLLSESKKDYFLNNAFNPYTAVENIIMAVSLEERADVYALRYKTLDYAYKCISGIFNVSKDPKVEKNENAFGASWISISGISMRPYFHTGDEVCIMSSQKYAPGDIVLYKYNGELLIHRVVERDIGHVWCKGDNAFRMEYVRIEDIKGRAVFLKRQGVIKAVECPGQSFVFKSLEVGKLYAEKQGNIEMVKNSATYAEFCALRDRVFGEYKR